MRLFAKKKEFCAYLNLQVRFEIIKYLCARTRVHVLCVCKRANIYEIQFQIMNGISVCENFIREARSKYLSFYTLDFNNFEIEFLKSNFETQVT